MAGLWKCCQSRSAGLCKLDYLAQYSSHSNCSTNYQDTSGPPRNRLAQHSARLRCPLLDLWQFSCDTVYRAFLRDKENSLT